MKQLTRIALNVALGAAVMSAVSFGAAAILAGGPVADGGGVIINPNSGNFNTVGFEAVEEEDGSITGEGVQQNHTTGFFIEYDLNQTAVGTDGATYLAGPVTGGNGPPVGWMALFAIQDNGPANKNADLHSNFFAVPTEAFPDLESVLEFFDGAFPPGFFYPLVKGNVTVH